MPRAEFNSKLAENPMNDHLLQVVEDIAPEIFVETNIGKVPVEDYREIVAIQNGFDSYDDLYRQGFRIGDDYDKPPENDYQKTPRMMSFRQKTITTILMMSNPSAVREALAERGIVNGELVDPESPGARPVIRQVNADVERLSHPAPKSAKRFLLFAASRNTKHRACRLPDH
jgi:hypothetical protein